MIKIEDMMTRQPHTLLRSDTLQDAISIMESHDIRHVPIVDEQNRLEGIISHRDVLAAQDSKLQPTAINPSIALASSLESVMGKNLITVAPKAGLKQCAILMQKHKIGCLPVVEQRKLIGIITDTDFVSIAISLIELQEESDPEESW